MAPHIPDTRVIRLSMPSAIPSIDFITNDTFGRMTRILTGYFLESPKGMAISLKKTDSFQKLDFRTY